MEFNNLAEQVNYSVIPEKYTIDTLNQFSVKTE